MRRGLMWDVPQDAVFVDVESVSFSQEIAVCNDFAHKMRLGDTG